MLEGTLAPDLSTLAASAAVELDLLINNEPTELDSVHQLAERFKEALGGEPFDQAPHRLQVDTATETILGEAFTRSNLAEPATVLDNLFNLTQKLAADLPSVANVKHDTKGLEWQRAFCLALSQSASTYRQLLFNALPTHPNRR